jgi:signal transduction histidine kinase
MREEKIRKQQEVFLALSAGEEKERKRLAEELHDGIGAKLSGIKMNIEYLNEQLVPAQQEHARQILNGLNESINELREISHNLQPSIIGIKGLRNALGDFVANLNKKKEAAYSFFWNDDYEGFPDQGMELNVYRITTELLHNIHKHAHAKNAMAQVMVGDGRVQILVEDDGKGFDTGAFSDGIGLSNIRNRVEQHKGSIVIDSRPGGGATIIIELPFS